MSAQVDSFSAYKVEAATTGRSACKRTACECSKKHAGTIPQGRIRWLSASTGGKSFVSSWYCLRPGCITSRQINNAIQVHSSIEEIPGMTELPDDLRTAAVTVLYAIHEERTSELDPTLVTTLEVGSKALPKGKKRVKDEEEDDEWGPTKRKPRTNERQKKEVKKEEEVDKAPGSTVGGGDQQEEAVEEAKGETEDMKPAGGAGGALAVKDGGDVEEQEVTDHGADATPSKSGRETNGKKTAAAPTATPTSTPGTRRSTRKITLTPKGADMAREEGGAAW